MDRKQDNASLGCEKCVSHQIMSEAEVPHIPKEAP